MKRSKKIIVKYSEESNKDLKKIDSKEASKIVKKIFEYTKVKPLQKAKKLKGKFSGSYRYRIGNYRAIFLHNDREIIIINIITIKHRKDIYK